MNESSGFWHLFGYFSSNAIHFLVVNRKIVSYFEKFNGLLFLMIEEFDGSFLIRAFLIEKECVYFSEGAKRCQLSNFETFRLKVWIS